MPHLPVGVRTRRKALNHFSVPRRAEGPYATQIRSISQHIGEIVRRIAPDGVLADVSQLIVALNRYGDLLHPWSESVAARMIADANRRNKASWIKHGREIGRALRIEIDSAPMGAIMRRLIAEQAAKITSLPRDAAERLFQLSTEALYQGTRAHVIAREVLRSGEVSASRANMLARTGVSTAATNLTRARSEYVGSVGYVWRTSRDGDVRPSHKRMEGKFVPWDQPPTLDGWTAHAGEYANCRCFPEPKIPGTL